jgi:hypothetical protein
MAVKLSLGLKRLGARIAGDVLALWVGSWAAVGWCVGLCKRAWLLARAALAEGFETGAKL